MNGEMKKITPQQFTVFTIITFFGSSLSAIGTFLAIGRVFSSVSMIAWALCLKTLAGVLFAGSVTRLIKKIGSQKALVLSQIIGIPLLCLLYYSFTTRNPIFVLSAIFISGLPGLFVNILIGPILRDLTESQDAFKRAQGLFQTFSGFGMLIAGYIAPLLLDGIGVSGLYYVDALTFVFGAVYTWRNVNVGSAPGAGNTEVNKPKISIAHSAEARKMRLIFLSLTSFLLIGLIPLSASSGNALHFEFGHIEIERLWMIECLAGIVTGYLYLRYAFIRHSSIIHYAPLLSSIPLVLVTRTKSVAIFYSAFLLFGILFTYGVNRFRDDFIEEASDFDGRVENSAYYQKLMNLLRTVSPLVIWAIVSISANFSVQREPDLLIIMQLFLAACSLAVLYFTSKNGHIWVKGILSNLTLLFSLVSVALMAGVILYRLEQYQKSQFNLWLESLPRSVLPHLIESDYIPINNKIDLIKKTALFKSIEILNKNGNYVAGFGETTSQCSTKLPIKDDTGTEWGVICAQAESGDYYRVLMFPFMFIALVIIGLGVWLSRILKLNAEREKDALGVQTAQAKLIKKISSQMAHDIRSPLAALDMITSTSKGTFTEDDRLIVRRAVGRIKDIANSLMDNYRADGVEKEIVTSEQKLTVELVLPLMESIISEARTRLRLSSKVLIDSNFSSDCSSMFCKIDSMQFKRVLSNLINNGIEACSSSGQVNVSLKKEDGKCVLEVTDNGKGIPSHILPLLGKTNVSFGKEASTQSGSGIGIMHAAESIRSWGGQIEFIPIEKGTTVKMVIPTTDIPAWFAGSIQLNETTQIVVCDDDSSVAEVWNDRFAKIDIGFQYVNSTSALRKLYQELLFSDVQAECLYLVDYELSDERKSGLDLIEELGLNQPDQQSRAILVTSHFEDIAIRDRCERIGVRILPKSLAAHILIEKLVLQHGESEPIS